MQSQLDQAISDAAAAEGTYLADANNVASIETAIQTATAPLAPAQAQMATDVAAFNAKLDALSAAALAAKIPSSLKTRRLTRSKSAAYSSFFRE